MGAIGSFAKVMIKKKISRKSRPDTDVNSNIRNIIGSIEDAKDLFDSIREGVDVSTDELTETMANPKENSNQTTSTLKITLAEAAEKLEEAAAKIDKGTLESLKKFVFNKNTSTPAGKEVENIKAPEFSSATPKTNAIEK